MVGTGRCRDIASEESKSDIPPRSLTPPPNIDPKTWAEIQRKWIDIKAKELEIQKENVKAFIELLKEGVNSLKDYYLKKIPRTTLPTYILISIVIVGAIILTLLGRISGETFAFLMGTIVGYIISLLSKH